MRIKRITVQNDPEPVYDLYVKTTHCFSVNGGLIVHNCDSLRYGMIAWTSAALEREEREERLWTKDMYDDWCRASADVRTAMEKMMGGAPTGYRYF